MPGPTFSAVRNSSNEDSKGKRTKKKIRTPTHTHTPTFATTETTSFTVPHISHRSNRAKVLAHKFPRAKIKKEQEEENNEEKKNETIYVNELIYTLHESSYIFRTV